MENNNDGTEQTDSPGPHISEQGRVGESDEDSTGVDNEYDDYYVFYSSEGLPEALIEYLEAECNKTGCGEEQEKFRSADEAWWNQ